MSRAFKVTREGEKSVIASKLLSKGQTTIPEEVRKHLGIRPGDKLLLQIVGDQVILTGRKTKK